MSDIRVGTSGYSFPDWVGTVYPRDLPQKAWLSYYARWFNAVEINSNLLPHPLAVHDGGAGEESPQGLPLHGEGA